MTLIETFAYMTDQLLYRLNRVPDRLYVKFLELIGIRLFPPTRGADRRHVLAVGAGDDDARHPRRARARRRYRGDGDEPVVFSTLRDLAIVPTELQTVATPRRRRRRRCDRAPRRSRVGAAVPAFGEVPAPGDMLLIGLDRAAPGNAVRVPRSTARSTASASTRPTRRWRGRRGTASTGRRASSSKDETGGLNRKGDIIVHLPLRHAGVADRGRAGRMAAGAGDRGAARASRSTARRRSIHGLAVTTVGGTAESAHAELDRERDRRRVERTAGPAASGSRAARSSLSRPATGDRGQHRRGLGGVGAGRVASPTAAPTTRS